MVCHCLLCFFLSITHADMAALGRVSGRSDRDAVTGGGSARPSRSTSESGRWARSLGEVAVDLSVGGQDRRAVSYLVVSSGCVRKAAGAAAILQHHWCQKHSVHLPPYAHWHDPSLAKWQAARHAGCGPTGTLPRPVGAIAIRPEPIAHFSASGSTRPGHAFHRSSSKEALHLARRGNGALGTGAGICPRQEKHGSGIEGCCRHLRGS